MKFKMNEMTWLCQIIKIRKLAGFEAFPTLTNEDADSVCNSLAKKGLLNKAELTDLGLSTIKTLSLYTNSKRFIKLGNNGAFANYQDNEYVLIVQEDDIYSVDLLSQDLISAIILSKFKTMNAIKDGDYKKRFISKHKFATFMEEHVDAEAVFYYKVDLENKVNDKSVLFISDGYFQHYNAVSEELHIYPKALVQQGIESIFIKEGSL